MRNVSFPGKMKGIISLGLSLMVVFLVPYSAWGASVPQTCGTQLLRDFGVGATPSVTLPFGVTTTFNPYDFDGGLDGGQYVLVRNPDLVDDFGGSFNNQWHNSPDHTGNLNGRMLIVNASFTPTVFYNEILSNLVPGATYRISSFIANIQPTDTSFGVLPNVNISVFNSSNFIIAGINTGPIAQTSRAAGMLFNEFSFFFTATETSHRLAFVNPAGSGSGNDLAVDDISVGIACDGSDALGVFGNAQHVVLPGISIGGGPDIDLNPFSSVNANSDDLSGFDDEEGVTLPGFIQGVSASISVAVTGVGGFLQAWIDWDGNNSFADAGEQIATSVQDGGVGDSDGTINGTIELNIGVPVTVTTAQTSARFRWSTDTSIGIAGSAPDGEVEDYVLTVIAGTPSLLVVKTANDTTDVAVGQSIIYTYVVTNNGNLPLTNIFLNDVHGGSGSTPVPNNETLTNDANGIGDSTDSISNNGIWDTLGVGDSVTFTAAYSVTQQDIDTLQ